MWCELHRAVAAREEVADQAAHQKRGTEEPSPFGNADQPDQQDAQNDYQFDGMGHRANTGLARPPSAIELDADAKGMVPGTQRPPCGVASFRSLVSRLSRATRGGPLALPTGGPLRHR